MAGQSAFGAMGSGVQGSNTNGARSTDQNSQRPTQKQCQADLPHPQHKQVILFNMF